MICPHCGAWLSSGASTRSTTKAGIQLDIETARSCFCSASLAELRSLYARAEENLATFLKTNFPGRQRKDIARYVREMENGLPLKNETLRRMQYNDRLRNMYEAKRQKEESSSLTNENETTRRIPTQVESLRGISGWLKDVL